MAIFLVRHLCLLIIATVALSACSNVEENTGSLRVAVSRGPENQPLLKVVGKDIPSYKLSDAPLAAHPADVALAIQEGYIAASDRWMQMDVLRRMGRGQFAEILGGRITEVIGDESTDYKTNKNEDAAYLRDMQILGLGLEEAVDNSWERIKKEHPETRDILLAYSLGVNRFLSQLETLRPDIIRQYGMVTRNSSYRPRPWEPRDSLAVSVGVSFHLSSSLEEKMRLGIIRFLMTGFMNGSQVFSDFLDLRPIENTFILGEKYQPKNVIGPMEKKKPFWTKLFGAIQYECKEKGFPFPNCERRAAFGSNNWVVSKEFSGTGASYLANDPHLPLTFPNFFYEVSLDSKSAGGTFKVAGVKPPGVPGVLIGHNENIGWGLTNLTSDVDDVYLESFTDASHESYASFKGGNKEVTKKIYPVLVRQPDGSVKRRDVTVPFTEHGPLFSELKPSLKKQLRDVEKIFGDAFSLNFGISYRWTGHPGTTEIVAILGVNRANDYAEFKKALQRLETGAQNFIFADKKGNIGYYAHGNFPVRKYASEENPPYTLTQSTKANPLEWAPEWREEIPEAFRQEGFIVTANNDPFGHSKNSKLSNYDDYFGFDFTDGLRAFRISNLLKAKQGQIDEKAMRDIQIDQRDELGAHFVPLLEAPGVMDKLPAAVKPYAEELVSWKKDDYHARASTHQGVMFNAFMVELMHEHFKWKYLDLGEPMMDFDTSKFEETYQVALENIYRSSPTIKTLYHKTKDRVESREGGRFDRQMEILSNALTSAVAKQGFTKGAAPVTLGDVNRLFFANLLDPFIPQMFSIGLKRGGSWETVDPAAPGFGPNFRMVLTLKENEPIKASIVLPGGNHDPLQDMDAIIRELTDWRDGVLRPMAPL